jgi:hypothetical protein
MVGTTVRGTLSGCNTVGSLMTRGFEETAGCPERDGSEVSGRSKTSRTYSKGIISAMSIPTYRQLRVTGTYQVWSQPRLRDFFVG